MPYLRHFWLGNTYLGSAEDHLRFVHAEVQQPQPYAMFCPTCGELWARMPVDGSSREWRIIGGYCERHPGTSRFVVPGSLILNWEPELYEILPEAVLRRELLLHLDLLEGLCPTLSELSEFLST